MKLKVRQKEITKAEQKQIKQTEKIIEKINKNKTSFFENRQN